MIKFYFSIKQNLILKKNNNKTKNNKIILFFLGCFYI